MKQVSDNLKIDKSSASRRINEAISRGFLQNLEKTRGRAAKIIMGDPLPEDENLLPDASELGECCSVDSVSEVVNIHLSPNFESQISNLMEIPFELEGEECNTRL